MTTPTPTTALTIRQTLSDFGPGRAERALALLAHEQGDEQLALLAKELTPAEVAQIMSEGDYTKPSMLAAVITPEQFVGSLHRLGAKWGTLRGAEDQAMDSLRAEVRDYMLSGLLTGNEEMTALRLTAVMEDDLAQDVLIVIAIREAGCPEFLRERDWASAHVGTWQELYMLIRDSDEKSFKNISDDLLALFDEDSTSDNEVGEEPIKVKRFLRRSLQSLVDQAAELGAVQEGPRAPVSLFTDY
jgi:hypothetical protein